MVEFNSVKAGDKVALRDISLGVSGPYQNGIVIKTEGNLAQVKWPHSESTGMWTISTLICTGN